MSKIVVGLEKGLKGNAGQFKRATTIEHKHECSMLDYADFNIQLCRQDWIDSVIWLAIAKHNTCLTVPVSDVYHKVNNGKFSGPKTTHSNNTPANRTYFAVSVD